jgi:hypothetical protein
MDGGWIREGDRLVRVRLRDIDGEFRGLLTLVELPLEVRAGKPPAAAGG